MFHVSNKPINSTRKSARVLQLVKQALLEFLSGIQPAKNDLLFIDILWGNLIIKVVTVQLLRSDSKLTFWGRLFLFDFLRSTSEKVDLPISSLGASYNLYGCYHLFWAIRTSDCYCRNQVLDTVSPVFPSPFITYCEESESFNFLY